jgi:hypothetical protein
MRVYLQNINTGEYYKGTRKWTFERGEAQNFNNVADALDLSQNFPGMSLEVVMAFADGRKFIRFLAGWGAPAQGGTRLMAGQWVE